MKSRTNKFSGVQISESLDIYLQVSRQATTEGNKTHVVDVSILDIWALMFCQCVSILALMFWKCIKKQMNPLISTLYSKA